MALTVLLFTYSKANISRGATKLRIDFHCASRSEIDVPSKLFSLSAGHEAFRWPLKTELGAIGRRTFRSQEQ